MTTRRRPLTRDPMDERGPQRCLCLPVELERRQLSPRRPRARRMAAGAWGQSPNGAAGLRWQPLQRTTRPNDDWGHRSATGTEDLSAFLSSRSHGRPRSSAHTGAVRPRRAVIPVRPARLKRLPHLLLESHLRRKHPPQRPRQRNQLRTPPNDDSTFAVYRSPHHVSRENKRDNPFPALEASVEPISNQG